MENQFTGRRVAYLDFMSIELRTLEGFVYTLLGSLGIDFEEGEKSDGRRCQQPFFPFLENRNDGYLTAYPLQFGTQYAPY
jgi:hypothetical protein